MTILNWVEIAVLVALVGYAVIHFTATARSLRETRRIMAETDEIPRREHAL